MLGFARQHLACTKSRFTLTSLYLSRRIRLIHTRLTLDYIEITHASCPRQYASEPMWRKWKMSLSRNPKCRRRRSVHTAPFRRDYAAVISFRSPPRNPISLQLAVIYSQMLQSCVGDKMTLTMILSECCGPGRTCLRNHENILPPTFANLAAQ